MYNLNEAEEVICDIIDLTLTNSEKGINESIVPSLVGEKGIGKTALPKQIAESRNMGFVQIDLSQIDELVTLVGYPVKLHSIGKKNKDGVVIFKEVDKDVLGYYIDKGWSLSKKEPKLGFAPPEWLNRLQNENGSILYFNDWNRCEPHIQQSVMEILQDRKYGSWRLPDNCVMICSQNPDNGEYMVNVQDSAQSDRIFEIPVKFDAEVWAEWAERKDLPSTAINFILKSPEMVTGDDVVKGISPRKWTKFFRMIEPIKDLRSEQSLLKVQKYGDMMIGDLSKHFVTFVSNGLDKIISPKEIMDLTLDDEDVINKIKESFYLDGNYRSDISSIVAIRLKNYLKVYAEKNGVKKADIDRLEKILSEDAQLFHVDSLFNILADICKNHKYLAIVQRPSISKILSRT